MNSTLQTQCVGKINKRVAHLLRSFVEHNEHLSEQEFQRVIDPNPSAFQQNIRTNHQRMCPRSVFLDKETRITQQSKTTKSANANLTITKLPPPNHRMEIKILFNHALQPHGCENNSAEQLLFTKQRAWGNEKKKKKMVGQEQTGEEEEEAERQQLE